MLKALPTKDEKERLKELYSYSILDSEPDSNFDDIVQLAAYICNTPIALVSLVDENRQWFKSKMGLEASETPRDVSFCGHAIHNDKLFQISNALNDERFRDNPVVTGEPKVIFYAGQPLVSANGYKLGTLCVIDHQEKTLSKDQEKALQALANQVIAQMELKKSNEKLRSAISEIETKTQQLQEQENRAQLASRLASLGEMAAGIAHEINNPLTIIQLCVMQLKSAWEKGPLDLETTKKLIGKIENTSIRVHNIVNSMRALSRQGSHQNMTEAKLETIFSDLVNICSNRLKKTGVNFTVNGPQNLTLKCHSHQISQVFLNLINNSLDSILEEPSQKERWIRIEVEGLSESVKIKVIDSGAGVDEAHLDQIMDPFFTTKPPGEGTGLGLSISQKIISEHQGLLTYDSEAKEPGFIIELPLPQSASNVA